MQRNSKCCYSFQSKAIPIVDRISKAKQFKILPQFLKQINFKFYYFLQFKKIPQVWRGFPGSVASGCQTQLRKICLSEQLISLSSALTPSSFRDRIEVTANVRYKIVRRENKIESLISSAIFVGTKIKMKLILERDK